MARVSYLGGGTMVRLDVYGPDRLKPSKRTKPKTLRTVADNEWLAVNKKSQRKKQVKTAPKLEADYKAEIKRRRKRAKKKT